MEKIFLNPQNQILPYSLNTLEVNNFQGIKHLQLQDLPCDAQWIFLTGENGFGKTSVLRSIPIAFSAIENSNISANYFTQKTPFLFKAHKSRVPLVGYGISRFNLSINKQADIDSTASLFKDDAIMESIEIEIKDRYSNTERFDTIKKLFCSIIPVLADITVEENILTDKIEVFYTEKGEDGNFQKVGLSDLAAGYRNIICMIGDMLIRLRRMQHESIDKKDFKNYEGIVLIDEFDAHLHPKYQYELPKLLSDVFPKVQFIVSTHSPIPLLGAPKDSAIVLKVNRTAAEGITVERMDETIPFDHLQPNALLTSPIFGFADLFPRRPVKEIVISNHWEDIESDFNLQNELKKLEEEGLL